MDPLKKMYDSVGNKCSVKVGRGRELNGQGKSKDSINKCFIINGGPT